jgi:hypothetical protein
MGSETEVVEMHLMPFSFPNSVDFTVRLPVLEPAPEAMSPDRRRGPAPAVVAMHTNVLSAGCMVVWDTPACCL